MNTDNILVNLIIVFKRKQLLKFVIILKTRTNYFIRIISFFYVYLALSMSITFENVLIFFKH